VVDFVERRSLFISLGLHVAAIIITIVGFPFLSRTPDPEPFVMTVEVVPIGAMTNLPSQQKPIQKKQETEAPKTQKPTPPTAKEKPAEAAPPKDAVPLPDKEKEEKKKPEENPEDKKDEKKKDELAELLNKMRQEAESKKNAKDESTQEENKTISDKPYDDSLPLSISEKDAIRSQFIKCWRMPAGSPNPEELVVTVSVEVSAEGEVLRAELASGQSGNYNSNPFFRAAADAAIRAVHRCSPLQNLPTDKYGSWREMELTFDPQELLF
jgi:outer membrane biosynthesis protein TonB